MNKRGGTLGLNLSIILAASFILAVVVFATQFSQDNGSFISISENKNLAAAGTLNGTLTTYNRGNNQTLLAVYGGQVQDGSDSLDRVSTFETGSEDSLPDVANLSKQAVNTLFGSNINILIIAGAFIAFLGLSYALYAWKTFKQGAPD